MSNYVFHLSGRITRTDNGQGVFGLRVEARNADDASATLLAWGLTNRDGSYHIELPAGDGGCCACPRVYVTIRDRDFGMVRLRAFGLYSYRVTDAGRLFREVSGTRDTYTREDVEEQMRNLIVASMTAAFGSSDLPFLDMAANQSLLGAMSTTSTIGTSQRWQWSLSRHAGDDWST